LHTVLKEESFAESSHGHAQRVGVLHLEGSRPFVMLTAPRKVFMVTSAVKSKPSKCRMVAHQLGAFLPGRIVHAVVEIDCMHCKLCLPIQCLQERSVLHIGTRRIF